MVSEVLLQLGTSLGLATLVFWVFYYEYDMPLAFNLLVIPPVLILGYVLSVALQFQYQLRMVYSLGVEFGALIVLLILYDLAVGRSSV
ncbi:MAG: hypothetical protein ABEJ04_07660 [Halobacteriaceae archaeon]